MTDLDFSFENNNNPKKGCLLLSEPFMADQYFERSVILLCDYDAVSSFGFVLNNYININLNKLDDDFPSINTKISVGGPVDTKHLYYIHTLGEQISDSILIKNDLYLGGDFDQLKTMLNDDPSLISKVRFFLGYSGWGEDQLEAELTEKSWVAINNIENNKLMDLGIENLWQFCMNKQGDRFKIMSNFPVDPSFN